MRVFPRLRFGLREMCNFKNRQRRNEPSSPRSRVLKLRSLVVPEGRQHKAWGVSPMPSTLAKYEPPRVSSARRRSPDLVVTADRRSPEVGKRSAIQETFGQN